MKEIQVGKNEFTTAALISGLIAAVFRYIFLQKYEEQYHFLLSVLMAVFIALLMLIIMPVVKKYSEIAKERQLKKSVFAVIGGISGMLMAVFKYTIMQRYEEKSKLLVAVTMILFITLTMMFLVIVANTLKMRKYTYKEK